MAQLRCGVVRKERGVGSWSSSCEWRPAAETDFQLLEMVDMHLWTLSNVLVSTCLCLPWTLYRLRCTIQPTRTVVNFNFPELIVLVLIKSLTWMIPELIGLISPDNRSWSIISSIRYWTSWEATKIGGWHDSNQESLLERSCNKPQQNYSLRLNNQFFSPSRYSLIVDILENNWSHDQWRITVLSAESFWR